MRLGRAGPHPRRHLVDVELPAVLEAQVDDVDVGADGAGRLEVGGVVGADHDGVVAGLEQRGGDAEQGRRRPGGDEHVVGVETVAARGHRLAQERVAEVVAVAEQQLVEVEVEAEVAQPPVGHRALRQVVGDGVVARAARATRPRWASGGSARREHASAAVGSAPVREPTTTHPRAGRRAAVAAAYGDAVTRRAWADVRVCSRPARVVHIDTRTRPPFTLEGPDALVDVHRAALEPFVFFEFAILNAVAEIDGAPATGRVYICELRHDREGEWTEAYGLYRDRYERHDSDWRIVERRYTSLARRGPPTSRSRSPGVATAASRRTGGGWAGAVTSDTLYFWRDHAGGAPARDAASASSTPPPSCSRRAASTVRRSTPSPSSPIAPRARCTTTSAARTGCSSRCSKAGSTTSPS